jgi:hypothetical protein
VDGKLEKLTREFVRRIHDSLGDDLVSVLLYGSAATGDFQPDFSDLNLLCVLRVVGVTELRRAGSTVQWWGGQKQATPLLLSLEEAVNAADAFPIEFQDITQSHTLLYGKNVFADLQVNPQHHRRQVEHELRSTLLRLRARYLALITKDDEVTQMMAKSLSTFSTLTRHALLLHGVQVSTQKRDILKAATASFGMNPGPFETLLAVRDGKQQIVGESVHSLFAAYLEQITRLIEAVDKLGKPQ